MRVAIVTGTTRGLGAALLSLCGRRFDAVVAVSRSATGDAADCTKFVEADLAHLDEDFDARLLRALPEAATEIDFFSNAGVLGTIAPAGSASESLSEAAAVNLLAPARICGLLLRRFGGGAARLRFVDISSGAALRPIAGWSSYCTTKAAARMYFDCVAADHPDVEVIHFDPGVMDTAMQRQIRSASPADMPDRQHFADLHEKGALASPDSVAQRLLDAIGTP